VFTLSSRRGRGDIVQDVWTGELDAGSMIVIVLYRTNVDLMPGLPL
jgi:hypothetical protein